MNHEEASQAANQRISTAKENEFVSEEDMTLIYALAKDYPFGTEVHVQVQISLTEESSVGGMFLFEHILSKAGSVLSKLSNRSVQGIL